MFSIMFIGTFVSLVLSTINIQHSCSSVWKFNVRRVGFPEVEGRHLRLLSIGHGFLVSLLRSG